MGLIMGLYIQTSCEEQFKRLLDDLNENHKFAEYLAMFLYIRENSFTIPQFKAFLINQFIDHSKGVAIILDCDSPKEGYTSFAHLNKIFLDKINRKLTTLTRKKMLAKVESESIICHWKLLEYKKTLSFSDLQKDLSKSLYKRKKREPSFDTNNNNKKQKIDDTTFNKDNQSAPFTLNKNTFFCPKKTDSVSALSIPAKKQEGSILSPIRYFGKKSLETCALLIEQYWPRDSNGNLLKVKQFIDPFCGSGNFSFLVAYHELADEIIMNDLDVELINLFKLIKRDPEKLIRGYDERFRVLFTSCNMQNLDESCILHDAISNIVKKHDTENQKNILQKTFKSIFEKMITDHLKKYAPNDEIHRILINQISPKKLRKLVTSFIKNLNEDAVSIDSLDHAILNQDICTKINLLMRKLIFNYFKELAKMFDQVTPGAIRSNVLDADERAINYLLIVNHSFGNKARHLASMSTRLYVGQSGPDLIVSLRSRNISELLQKITLTNMDYAACINQYKQNGCLVFLDPPYFNRTNTYNLRIDENQFKENLIQWLPDCSLILTIGSNELMELKNSFQKHIDYVSENKHVCSINGKPSATAVYATIHTDQFTTQPENATPVETEQNNQEIPQMGYREQPFTLFALPHSFDLESATITPYPKTG